MIPIHDSVRGRAFPWVNVAIIAVNFLVFFFEIALSQQDIRANFTELDRFIRDWGNVPACMWDAYGGDRSFVDICRDQPRSDVTLLTSMFIHGGWLHIIGNMLFLWIFGDNVEDAMGHWRYAIFYALGGIVAGLAQAAVDMDSATPAIGASGAVAAVMAAYVVLYPRATVAAIIPPLFFFAIPVPAILLIGIWFVLQVVNGYASLGVDAYGAGDGIAYFAHLGGFAFGAAAVHLFVWGRPRRPAYRRSVS